ncbi:hypothetical protein GUJ93_ZPchr0007g5382 [Zizania palustris]|uniref:Uncharacterized protein n=1 Tax=Zizania palustris TaxID=103762 RepID=A0A8J5W6H5_ZIZPA|nr:hypothetical protein GUJ93_ZPchr0007g5382 [Zizania palustris]
MIIGKRVLASFPGLVKKTKAGLGAEAMVAQVSENGDIIDDSEGKVMGLVTSVTEFNGDLYIGSLAANLVGRLSLSQLGLQEQAEE